MLAWTLGPAIEEPSTLSLVACNPSNVTALCQRVLEVLDGRRSRPDV